MKSTKFRIFASIAVILVLFVAYALFGIGNSESDEFEQGTEMVP